MSRADTDTRVLLALLAAYRLSGRATVRSVSSRAGLPLMTVHTALTRLRHDGLVAWTEGSHGTLRPLVEVIG